MADYDSNRLIRGQAAEAGVMDAGLRAYMLRVYNYMLVGLGLTAGASWLTASSPELLRLFFQVGAHGTVSLSMLGWVVLLAPFALVLLLSFRLDRMSLGTAQAVFWVYAGLTGVSLAPIFLIYTGAAIAQTFFVTAATFGAMSLWGYTTKRDLTGFGSFLFMGLIGIVIAWLVNFFLQSSMMSWIISMVGVLVFTGLTAYDTQWIKNSYSVNDDGSIAGRKAIFGALKLYLDFLNLFLMLLRLFGDRR
ncbi:MAG TPA: Bax inhibitor-1/YccA family protein [Rhizomicrobium sp.]|nr:Bax inhibitor-1/YccA family protein [Rhizomicrobium sp.]